MKKLFVLIVVLVGLTHLPSFAGSIHEKPLTVHPVNADGKVTYAIKDADDKVVFVVKNPLNDSHRVKGVSSTGNPQGVFQIGTRRYIEDVSDMGRYVLIYTFELRGSRFIRVSLRSEPKGEITPFVDFKSNLESDKVAKL